jgi:hypothetical protein
LAKTVTRGVERDQIMSAVVHEKPYAAAFESSETDYQTVRTVRRPPRAATRSAGVLRWPAERRDVALADVIALPLSEVSAGEHHSGHAAGSQPVPVPTSADEMWFYDRKHGRR